MPSQDEHRIRHLLVQLSWPVDLIPKVVDVAQLERGNAGKESLKLGHYVHAEGVFRTKLDFSRGRSYPELKPQHFQTPSSIRVQDPERDGDSGPAVAGGPAFLAFLGNIRWQEMKAQHVDASGAETLGDTLQVSAGIRFRGQMAKRVEGAECGIRRPVELEPRHVRMKHSSLESSPPKASLKIVQRRAAVIQANYPVAARGEGNY